MISSLRSSRPQSWLLLLFLMLPTVLLYGKFLWSPVVFDDQNFFGGSIHPKYLTLAGFDLRWLPYASFEWTRVVLGLDIYWYRLGNLVLHLAAAGLLFAFLRSLFMAALPADWDAPAPAGEETVLPATWLAFFGALAFALHPASVYAVGYLVQRSTLMATLFTFLMWWLLVESVQRGGRRWWLGGSALAYFLAAFSKEHAIMAPAVALCIVLLLRRPDRKSLKQLWPVFVAYGLIAIWVLIQRESGHIIGQAYEPRGSSMLSQLAAHDPGFDRDLAYPLSMLTQTALFFKYLLLWIVPNPGWMSIDMYEPFAMRLWSWPHVAGMLAFMLYPVAAIRLLLKRGAAGLLGLALLSPWLMFATEMSTVRIQESFVIYRSYLWMGGLMAALPWIFRQTSARRAAFILTALALVLMPASWDRLTTFSKPLLLWNDAAKLVAGKENRPGVERVYHNRGVAFFQLGRYAEATADYNKAISIQPLFIHAFNDRGAVNLVLQKYQEALNDFNKALELNPEFIRSILGRGLALEGLGNMAAAREDFKRVCERGFVEGCAKLRPPASNPWAQHGK